MSKIIRTFNISATTAAHVGDIRQLLAIATPLGILVGAAINLLR